MKIKTKFDIGDLVWGIQINSFYKWQIYDSIPFEIEKICVEKDHKKTTIEYEEFEYWNVYLEDEVFVEKVEAQAECDRRNR